MAEVKELFGAWREWCEVTREVPGTEKRFSQCLDAQGFERCKHPTTRRACFRGIKLPMDENVGLVG